MSNWTDELKQKVIKMYQDASPTPETSVEIVKSIAEDVGESANGVRLVLIKAEVYLKKEAATSSTKPGATKPEGEGTKRVSKESQVAALKLAIEAKGGKVDEDILSKLTGKAAAYFTEVLTK